MLERILLLLIFLAYSLGALGQDLDDDYKLYKISADGAKCLDGTQPGFYYHKGSESEKWIIFFEGGGWCGTPDPNTSLENCYERSLTDLGSSKNYPEKKNYDGDGLLSNKRDRNKYFYHYSKIYVKYCDGTGHQGFNTEPFTYKGHDLWFRGYANTNETLNYAWSQLNLKSANEVMVAGCSAGGLAAYTWVDHVASLFPAGQANVYGVGDAGIFLDVENVVAKDYTFRKTFQNFMKFSNAQFPVVSAECAAAHPTEQWKCMFFEYMVEFIRSPTFISESEYDLVSLPVILGTDCVSDFTLKKCTSDQRSLIGGYRKMIVQLMKDVLAKHQTWGAWAPACVQHCFCQGSIFYDKNYEVPQLSYNTVESSLDAWKVKKQRNFIDEVEWPANKPCAGADAGFAWKNAMAGQKF